MVVIYLCLYSEIKTNIYDKYTFTLTVGVKGEGGLINKKTSVVVRSIKLTIEGTIIVMECYDTCAAVRN